MLRFAKTVTLFLASALWLLGADPTGVWKADYQSPDGAARTSTFHLKAEGEKLTGKIVSGTGDAEIKDGTVKGDDISFTVVRNFGGQDVTLKYTGKVSAEEIKMNIAFGDQGGFDIVAKKQKP